MNTTLSARRYFIATGLLSLILIGLYVASKSEWIQISKETLGLEPRLQAEADSFYNSRIDPIFEKYCVSCHDDNKDKGYLRLNTFRNLSFSGRSGSDLLAEDNNLVIERMSLPATDRLAMPPYGRERHSDAELDLIELWLSKGGSGKLTEADFPNAPKKAKVIAFAPIDWRHVQSLREPLKAEVDKLKQRFPHTLDYIARTSEFLSLNAYSVRQQFDDNALSAYLAVAEKLQELKLAQTDISNAAMNSILSMNQLMSLDISGTRITSTQLLSLLALPKLKTLRANADLFDAELTALFERKGVNLTKVGN